MDNGTKNAIARIDGEIARLQSARAVLVSLGTRGQVEVLAANIGRRTFSAAARRRMSAGMRAFWKRRKAAAKGGAK